MTIPQLRDCNPEFFRPLVWDFYSRYARSFPWRETREPFAIFISEIMLQQTQTQRVLPKYERFLHTFDSFLSLARAELPDILPLWSGLGYNRRAKFLLQAARMVIDDFNGVLPDDPQMLVRLPGVGPNTAGSLSAFVYNQPVVFIETNIRRVFLHYFFPEQTDVPDSELFPLIEQMLDYDSPREWYYALMDLGVALKSKLPNANRRSRHYTRQSPFENSQRQIRGRILRLLQENPWLGLGEVAEWAEFPTERVSRAVKALEHEGFIERYNGGIQLSRGGNNSGNQSSVKG